MLTTLLICSTMLGKEKIDISYLTNYVKMEYQGSRGAWYHWRELKSIATDLQDYKFLSLKEPIQASNNIIITNVNRIDKDIWKVSKKKSIWSKVGIGAASFFVGALSTAIYMYKQR